MDQITKLDNGNLLVDVTVDCHRRPTVKKTKKVDNQQASQKPNNNSEDNPQEDSEEDKEAEESQSNRSDVVADRWRLISADILYPSMGGIPVCVDYSHNDGHAIKQACEIMNARQRRVPVTWNHTNDVMAVAGYVDRCNVENSRDIPFGVNGYINIPRAYDAKAATGIETGILNAGSISISCEMQKSHDMPLDRFLDLMGEEVDGEVVRFLPVNARDVLHYALVQAGADNYAGPRANHSKPKNTQITGGSKNMENIEKAIKMLSAVCENMGLEVVIDENTIPESLEARLIEKLEGLVDAKARYNTLAEQVNGLAGYVQTEAEDTLKASEILNRLPDVLNYAEHGHRYVEDLKAEALRAFDAAKVDPDQAELSASAKAIRKVIENTTDIEALKAYCEEYTEKKNAHFDVSENRSSEGEELPENEKKDKFDRKAADIKDNVSRLFR